MTVVEASSLDKPLKNDEKNKLLIFEMPSLVAESLPSTDIDTTKHPSIPATPFTVVLTVLYVSVEGVAKGLDGSLCFHTGMLVTLYN